VRTRGGSTFRTHYRQPPQDEQYADESEESYKLDAFGNYGYEQPPYGPAEYDEDDGEEYGEDEQQEEDEEEYVEEDEEEVSPTSLKDQKDFDFPTRCIN
jgi:hypothetical protein